MAKPVRGPCPTCGRNRRLTVDHIIPQVFGGDNSPENLRFLCEPCNTRRGHGIDETVWSRMSADQKAKLKHWCFGDSPPLTEDWAVLFEEIVKKRIPGFRRPDVRNC